MAVAAHFPILLVGPLLVALVAYFLASNLVIEYRSTSLLKVDQATARSIEGLVTSPAVADAILSTYAGTGNSPESHASFLSQHMRLSDTESPTDRPGEHLFRLDVTHSVNRTAQSISSAVIDTWLDSTRPRGTQRAYLEAELERNKLAAAANSKLIEGLQREATTFVSPNSLSGELATPISALISKRDQHLAAINSLDARLQGVSRDVIVQPPHLPRDPVPSRKQAMAILSGIAAIPVFLAFILLGRYFAPSVSAFEMLSRRFRRTP